MTPARHSGRVASPSTAVLTPGRTIPGVVLRAEAVAAGYSADEIRRLCRSGAWVRLAAGAYVVGPNGGTLTDDERHRALAAAVLPRLPGAPVLSHLSAAAVHGLPWWGAPRRLVDVTRASPSRAHLGPLVHSRTARLTARDIVVSSGLAVTSATRTVFDVGRTCSFEEALVVTDAALQRGLVTRRELSEASMRWQSLPGSRSASRVIAFADGRSESVGESRSRVMFARAALPPPDLQYAVRDVRGREVARVDFAFPDRKVVGEFDGAVKYGRFVPSGSTPGDVVFREKVREDAIRAAGWSVVRWTWADLDRPRDALNRMQRALADIS